MNHNKKSKEGFTLIELLVVIAIIGILSSVVLASLNTARQKSRDARRISDMGQMKLAFELYFDTNGQYPDTGLGAGQGIQALVDDDLLPSLPIPPNPVGVGYLYNVVGANVDYCLGGDLENNTHPNRSQQCTTVLITDALNFEHRLAP